MPDLAELVICLTSLCPSTVVAPKYMDRRLEIPSFGELHYVDFTALVDVLGTLLTVALEMHTVLQELFPPNFNIFRSGASRFLRNQKSKWIKGLFTKSIIGTHFLDCRPNRRSHIWSVRNKPGDSQIKMLGFSTYAKVNPCICVTQNQGHNRSTIVNWTCGTLIAIYTQHRIQFLDPVLLPWFTVWPFLLRWPPQHW